jgi:putative DNA primase/helicase
MTGILKLARFAERYAELGLALTWTPPGAKGPRHAGWNLPENAITDPAAALDYWTRNPRLGVAMLLEPSGLVSIDVDDEGLTRDVLRHFGVDIRGLREAAPTVVGRHYRLIYRAPPDLLKHRSLAWPRQDDSRSNFVLFEFRAGNIADTLPPTVHPGIGQPYRWENPPRHGFPELPARVLELWRDWPNFSRQALQLCPWWEPPPDRPSPAVARTADPRGGDSVIGAFNQAHDVTGILEAAGYTRRGKRFASPGTKHAAGVVILEPGRVYCHQQGDRLCSEHALDAFDLFRILDHGGDYRSAVRAAAELLGLNQEGRRA